MKKSGTSVLTVIGIVFIILKLVGALTWSWWWVLAPFWAIPVFWVSVWLFIFMCAFIIAVANDR